MFLVKNFTIIKCLPAAHQKFNFFPNKDILIHSLNGLRIPLIHKQVVEQYNGTHKLVEFSLFNKAGIGSFPCEIGQNGIFYLILPEGKIIDQLRHNISEIYVNIYISENSVLYCFYNPTDIEKLILDIKIVNDERNIFQSIKSDPTNISFTSNEKDRILNCSKQLKSQENNDNFSFYSEGDRWFFMFDGKEARNINHKDGFVYIQTLLKYPNRQFTAWELQCGIKGIIPEISTSAQEELNANTATLSITEDFRENPMYDKQETKNIKTTIKFINEKISELKEEKITLATENGMVDESDYIVKIEKEIKKLDKTKAIYQSGTEKNKQRERARQSVQKSISRCAKIIRRVLPELADFLRMESKYKPTQKIQTGHTCIYNIAPGQDKYWRFS